jgi:hypothetical protein
MLFCYICHFTIVVLLKNRFFWIFGFLKFWIPPVLGKLRPRRLFGFAACHRMTQAANYRVSLISQRELCARSSLESKECILSASHSRFTPLHRLKGQNPDSIEKYRSEVVSSKNVSEDFSQLLSELINSCTKVFCQENKICYNICIFCVSSHLKKAHILSDSRR